MIQEAPALDEQKRHRSALMQRSVTFLRLLHYLLPLEQRINPILRMLYGTADGLLRIPWGKYWLTVERQWLRIASSASAPLYRTPKRQNIELYKILVPQLHMLKPGSIIDVGANIGIYVLCFCEHSTAAIVAFEPEPTTFSLLEENVNFNNLHNVSLRNLACGNQSGHVHFEGGLNGHVSSTVNDTSTANTEIISVPIVSLDEEIGKKGKISLIKIDCEGYEWHVLDGCREILRTQRPVLFVELHPNLIGNFDRTVTDVCDLLTEFYELSFWDVDSRRRSANRAIRLLARFHADVNRLASVAEMENVADRQPRPDQLFMLALPR